MADFKVYGHPSCPEFAATRDYLTRSGACVEPVEGTLPADLQRQLGNTSGPVTVRGTRYVTGGDPARLQSLMY
jgi:hypothetical protein